MNETEQQPPSPSFDPPPTSLPAESAEAPALVGTTEPGKDPFDFLMNAGSDGGLWALLGGPFLILVMIAVVYSLLIYFKRRKENREFIKNVEEAEDPDVIPLPSRGRSGRDDSLDSPDGSPIKPYKVPEELETQASEGAATHSQASAKFQGAPSVALVQPLRSEDPEVAAIRSESVSSLKDRLKRGLARTREAFQSNLQKIFVGKTTLSPDLLEQLHETLYRADFGGSTVDQLVESVKTSLAREDQGINWDTVSRALRQKTRDLLKASQEKPLNRPPPGQPWVILVVGVNGVGKTTSIGKLAAHFLAQNQKVLLVAADTFRAAAIEQLSVWGDRLGVEVIKHQSGSDPAAVAYDGVKAGLARGADVVLIDTAGRLHAKADLMAELAKINRIVGRDLPGAPHETWLVVDATTGQNAVQQVKAFREVAPISGLVVTKLDGTAKGGVIVGISDQFKVPVRYIGVGEKAADLRLFEAQEFADSLF